MKRYFDLSESERAALTMSEVEAYEAAELMHAACVQPDPLPPKPTKPDIGPSKHVYSIKVGYSTLDVAFSSLEEAQHFLDTRPLVLHSSYGEDPSVQIMTPNEATVELVEAHGYDNVQAHKAALSDYRKALENWKRLESKHEQEMKDCRIALDPMWSDWEECKDRRNHLDKIRRTFEEYVGIAGSHDVAIQFLRKAFSPDDIDAMLEWFGIREEAA